MHQCSDIAFQAWNHWLFDRLFVLWKMRFLVSDEISHQKRKRKKPHPKMATKPKQTKKRKTQSIQNTSQNSTPWATPSQPNSYGVQKASHILPCWTNTPFPCWTNTEHFSMLQAYWKYFLCVVSPLLLNLIVRQVMKLIGQPLEWIVKSVSISKILLFWCIFTKKLPYSSVCTKNCRAVLSKNWVLQ